MSNGILDYQVEFEFNGQTYLVGPDAFKKGRIFLPDTRVLIEFKEGESFPPAVLEPYVVLQSISLSEPEEIAEAHKAALAQVKEQTA
jgi:hypothetical protein